MLSQFRITAGQRHQLAPWNTAITEKLTVAQLIINSFPPLFMKPEVSLPHSAVRRFPGPNESESQYHKLTHAAALYE